MKKKVNHTLDLSVTEREALAAWKMDWGGALGRRRCHRDVRCCGRIREEDTEESGCIGRFIDFFCKNNFKSVVGSSQTATDWGLNSVTQ